MSPARTNNAEAQPNAQSMISHGDAMSVRTEWQVLSGLVDDARRLIGEQDGSPVAEDLCGALITAMTRMRESLRLVFRLGVLAYVTSSILHSILG